MPIQLSGSLVITGSITTTGVITMSGSIASASYSSTSDLLQGTGSVGFATTASLLAVSSSQQQISASLLNVVANYATTGSNSFRANQSITGSLVVSSTITAQTLVVQTVTSSILYSSGSNNFGNQLSNNQTFTGSVNITGSLAIAGNITGNAITLTSALDGTSATFSGNNHSLASNNTLRFTDTDTATEANQQIGKIEFYSSDSSTPGAGVKAYIGAFAQDTTPDAYLSFATQDGSATPNPVERLRISSEGLATFSSSVAATQFSSQGGRGTSYGYKLPDWQIYNTTSGNALAFSNYTTDFLTITSGGNVLVGTISGNSVFPVTISGDGSTKSGAIQFKNNGVDVLYLGTPTANDSVNIQMYNPNSGYIRFATNSEERLRITSGGDIRITSNGTTNAATLELVSSATPSSGSSISVSYLGAGSYGPLTFGTGGTERMRITSNGNILINQTSALSGVPTSIEMSGVGSSTPTLQASYNVFANHGAANTSWRGYYVFHRSRGTTAGSVTAVANEDFLGTIRWNGADGTGEIIAAEINAKVDGTVGTNDMPTRLEFSTTADGGSGPTERLRITNSGQVRVIGVGNTLAFDTDGSGASTTLGTNGQYDFRIYNARGGASNIDVSTYEIGFGMNGSTNRYRMGNSSFYPSGDNAYSCGASGQRWSVIWAATNVISTSDRRQKKDITNSNLGLDFIMALNPVSYKWKVGKNVVTSDGERIDENGAKHSNDIITPVEGVRTHYGLIAQEVKEALGNVDFGGYIHDEETDVMGLRYEQFIAPLIKAIQELEARVKELEKK